MKLVVSDESGRIVQAIETAIQGVSDFRPLFDALRPVWERRSRLMFESNGRSTGTPWVDYTAEERARYVPMKAALIGRSLASMDQTILRWDGVRERLRPSLVNTRHPLAIFRTSPKVLQVGTRSPGAPAHEYGNGRAPDRWGGYAIPRRRILGFGREFARSVSVEVGKFAATVGTRRAGFSSADLAAMFRNPGGR